MAKAQAETVIDRPADEVWARIRDFGDLTWVPNTATCRLDGDVRFITMAGGNFEVVERLLSQDDAQRTCTYDLAREVDLEPVYGPGFKITHLVATLTVTPNGDAASHVTWDVDTEEFSVAGTHAEYQAALDNLKGLLEA